MKQSIPAWLVYLTPVGWFIAWIQYRRSGERSPLLLLHLRQMMGLMILLSVIWISEQVVLPFPGKPALFFSFNFLLFLSWLIGLKDAILQKERTLPIIGPLLQVACMFLR